MSSVPLPDERRFWLGEPDALERSRPRAVSRLFLHEDADAVADQLRALIRFSERNPEVAILVSRDAARLEEQIAAGVVASGLR